MKAVILAGGLGTRISEETENRPKPMVEIGGKPILWHIMKTYAEHGVTDFIICLGYKGYVIKEYFNNFLIHHSDVKFDFKSQTREILAAKTEPWTVSLIDTGEKTMIGGRIKRILPYIGDDDAFCLTYGDGVGNVDITSVIEKHRTSKCLVTVTAALPPGRFGALLLDKEKVTGFQEKPAGDGGWINAGYFVLSPQVGDYIEGDATVWEQEPMEKISKAGLMQAHFHDGFWQPMDTLRDKRHLESLWNSGEAPWKIWS